MFPELILPAKIEYAKNIFVNSQRDSSIDTLVRGGRFPESLAADPQFNYFRHSNMFEFELFTWEKLKAKGGIMGMNAAGENCGLVKF